MSSALQKYALFYAWIIFARIHFYARLYFESTINERHNNDKIFRSKETRSRQ